MAPNNLGIIFDKGQGVPENDREAVRWYRMAADQGKILSPFNLATMYSNGEGVSQDYIEAIRWYQIAADQGNASAQNTCLNGIYHSKVGYLRRILAVKALS